VVWAVVIYPRIRTSRGLLHVSRTWEKRIEFRILEGKPEGMRLLGRPRNRWMDNIKLDLVEVDWGGIGGSHLSQNNDQ
jgi:hypothetical protein